MTELHNTIVRPVYYRIIERRRNGWAFKHGTPFINLLNAPLLAQDDLLAEERHFNEKGRN